MKFCGMRRRPACCSGGRGCECNSQQTRERGPPNGPAGTLSPPGEKCGVVQRSPLRRRGPSDSGAQPAPRAQGASSVQGRDLKGEVAVIPTRRLLPSSRASVPLISNQARNLLLTPLASRTTGSQHFEDEAGNAPLRTGQRGNQRPTYFLQRVNNWSSSSMERSISSRVMVKEGASVKTFL